MLSLFGTIPTTIAALCIVIGLVMAAAKIARTTGLATVRPGAPRRLLLLETLALDRVRRLALISLDGHEVLLLTGGSADQVLNATPLAPEQPTPEHRTPEHRT